MFPARCDHMTSHTAEIHCDSVSLVIYFREDFMRMWINKTMWNIQVSTVYSSVFEQFTHSQVDEPKHNQYSSSIRDVSQQGSMIRQQMLIYSQTCHKSHLDSFR